MMESLAVVSFAAGPIYDRVGPRTSVSAGAALATAGMLLLSRVGTNAPYEILLLAMIIKRVGLHVEEYRRRSRDRRGGNDCICNLGH